MAPERKPWPAVMLASLCALQGACAQAVEPATTAAAPGGGKAPGAVLAALDCEIVGGHVIVPVVVGGHAATAIIDTGAQASILDLALAQEWDLPSHGGLKAVGSGGESVDGALLIGVMLTIGGLEEPLPYAVPLGDMAASCGRRLEVVLGRPFFGRHAVEIDYAQRRVRILEAPDELAAGAVVLPLRLVRDLPHVTLEMTIGSEHFTLDTMVDTGARSSGLTARFMQEHVLDVPDAARTAKTVLSRGVGGATEGRWFRPDTLSLGSVALARPVLSMQETAGGVEGQDARHDLAIGGDVLCRFRVTFDYAGERMILQPTDVSRPFEADKTGLLFLARDADLRRFEVVGVLPGSSAEAAGVQVGDMLESVDGETAAGFELQTLRDRLRAPGVPQWTLGLRRGDRTLTVVVAAKSII